MPDREQMRQLRHTATAQQHSSQDAHSVSVKPSVLLALLAELEQADKLAERGQLALPPGGST